MGRAQSPLRSVADSVGRVHQLRQAGIKVSEIEEIDDTASADSADVRSAAWIRMDVCVYLCLAHSLPLRSFTVA